MSAVLDGEVRGGLPYEGRLEENVYVLLLHLQHTPMRQLFLSLCNRNQHKMSKTGVMPAHCTA
jgi:hypothetical protein